MRTKFFPCNLRQAVARSFNNRRRARWAAALLTLLLLAGTAAASVTFVLKWGSYGTGDGQFIAPLGVAVNSAGQVYVIDFGYSLSPNPNHRIEKFDANGNFLAQWGSYGSGDGQFTYPFGVAVDSSGKVYVADTGNVRIQKFDANGAFLSKFDLSNNAIAFDVAVSPAGNIYFCGQIGTSDADGNPIVNAVGVLDANGNLIDSWGGQGSDDGQFNSFTFGIALDSAGNVYVSDTGNNRIQKFDASGNFITKWGSQGSGDGQFNTPAKVAVDSAGNVYVTDPGNSRVQKFDANGNFIEKWGSQGTGDGQFNQPFGVAVNSSGQVYVADADNHRVQKFGQAYAFSGFFQPVDNPPTVNVAKAGAAIPVKFSLGGDQGLGIFATGFPSSQQIACSSSSPASDIEEAVTVGGSGLTYDPTTDQYTYIWKTSTTWKGQCRKLTVKLNDGSVHTANFQFK